MCHPTASTHSVVLRVFLLGEVGTFHRKTLLALLMALPPTVDKVSGYIIGSLTMHRSKKRTQQGHANKTHMVQKAGENDAL